MAAPAAQDPEHPSVGRVVALWPLGWISMIVVWLSAPFLGPHQPDPGAGAGPDVWDLNVATTQTSALIAVVVNTAAWALVLWRSNLQEQRVLVAVVVTVLISAPAFLMTLLALTYTY